MKVTKFIFLISLFMSLIGCRKETAVNKYTISGRILKDCSNSPIANGSFTIVNNNNFDTESDDMVYPFVTDNNGYFSVEYENISSSTVTINNQIGGIVHVKIGNINVGDIMVNNRVNYELSIKYNNSYVAGDTIAVKRHGVHLFKIPYPFNDTVMNIDSIIFGPVGTPGSYDMLDSVDMSLLHYVYSGQRGTSSFNVKTDRYNNFRFGSCTRLNPIEITVD